MFRFSKRARLRNQLDETIAFIHKKIRIDRDILTAKDIILLHTSADEATIGINDKQPAELERDLERLNEVYEKVFPPRRDHWIRENGEILLVAILVAMAFRAYFLQPFRIPTGSMQPTLYGIDVLPRMAMTENGEYLPPPPPYKRLFERVFMGRKYVYVKCIETGNLHTHYQPWGGSGGIFPQVLSKVERGPLRMWRWLFPSSQFKVGNVTYTVPVAKEQMLRMFNELSKTRNWIEHPKFEKGEVMLNFVVVSGDHLFVDRMSYNFVKPKRGDIFVFETKGIPVNASGQFYIKRCVGLPGETLQIKNDDRLYVNGESVPAEGPFKKIYSKQDGYVGHFNMKRLHQEKPQLKPPLPEESYLVDENDKIELPAGWYWAMGDNTGESRDSRYFGPIPQKNLVGRAFFVYWPFGSRWGVPE